MSDDLTSARSKLDFLYQDVLGEVAGLVARLEKAGHQLDSTRQRIELAQALITQASTQTDAAAKFIGEVPARVSQRIQEGTGGIAEATAKTVDATLAGTRSQLDVIARESAGYARMAHASARRMALIAVLVGGLSGVLGGLIAGIALGQLIG